MSRTTRHRETVMEGVEDLVITVEADAPALLRALLALEDRIGEGETATSLRSAGEALMAALDALARWDSADLTDEEVERRIAVEEERSRQEALEEHAQERPNDAPPGEGPLH
jgi:fructoselysine-6-P-deglycase FrlB-like protein